MIETAAIIIMLTRPPVHHEPKPVFPIIFQENGKQIEVRQTSLGNCAAWESEMVMVERHQDGVHFSLEPRHPKKMKCKMIKTTGELAPSILLGQ